MSIITRDEELNKEVKEVKAILQAIGDAIEYRAADWDFHGIEEVFINKVRILKSELNLMKKRVCLEGEFAEYEKIEMEYAKAYVKGGNND